MGSPPRRWSSFFTQGVATATAERVVAGSKMIEVARVRIIEAGREMLSQLRWL
jgi:hypothetical protein